MKTLKTYVLTLLFAGTAVLCFSQNKVIPDRPFTLTKKPVEHVWFLPTLGNSVVVVPHFLGSMGLIPHPENCNAAFCRMERKSATQLGLWVKIHAGNYDAYMNGIHRFN